MSTLRLDNYVYTLEAMQATRNTLSAKILRGMTVEDIPHLQNLKPLKSFELPPGDSIPFAIVFLKSTKSAKDVTCEVVLADSEI